MGPLEEKIREIVGGFCESKLLDKTVEELLESHSNIYALFAMSQLMAAQESASEMAKKRDLKQFAHFQGKIEAYKELFVKVAFDGLSVEDGTVTDEMLQKARLYWQQQVHIFIQQALLQQSGG